MTPDLAPPVRRLERAQHAAIAAGLGLTLEQFDALVARRLREEAAATCGSNVVGSAGNESQGNRPRPVNHEAAPAA